MLTAARRCAAARDLICDPAHCKRIHQFAQKQILMDVRKRRAHKTVHGFFRDHHRKVIERCVAHAVFIYPVIERRDLGHQIPDSGI